jgi:NAD(P)-dependent dehydrogenase (short-subunit alcohol dehydrogenase family)
MQLSGKTAIVTGGGVRLGRAISLALAAAGMRVCVHFGHSCDEAAETVDRICTQGVKAIAVQADFCEPVSATQFVMQSALDEFGEVDVLINSAAIFEQAGLEGTDESLWDRHFDVNLKAPVFLCKEFARQFSAGRRGHIVNISDWRATRPGTGYLAYTLTKSGLTTLTRMLAQELAPNVQVNAVAPGAILPPPGGDEAAFAKLAERIPLGRTGTVHDVTDAVLFLLQSDFITGEVLHISGGEQIAGTRDAPHASNT